MAASPTAWLQERPKRHAGREQREGKHCTCLGQRKHFQRMKETVQKEREREKGSLGGAPWGGNKFIDAAAIGFELAFVPLKGVRFKSVPQRRQGGGTEMDVERGRLEGACLSLLQRLLNINQIMIILLTCLAEAWTGLFCPGIGCRRVCLAVS